MLVHQRVFSNQHLTLAGRLLGSTGQHGTWALTDCCWTSRQGRTVLLPTRLGKVGIYGSQVSVQQFTSTTNFSTQMGIDWGICQFILPFESIWMTGKWLKNPDFHGFRPKKLPKNARIPPELPPCPPRSRRLPGPTCRPRGCRCCGPWGIASWRRQGAGPWRWRRPRPVSALAGFVGREAG